MRRRSERGDGNVGCIVWLLVLVIVVVIGWKAIPVKLRTSQLYDHMVELSKFSPQAPPDDLERSILKRAGELELPLDKEGVVVQRIGDRIKMEARYAVPLHYPGYTYEWEFNHVVDRPIFIF